MGDAWSAPASRSIPTASSSSAPTSSAAAWARPGPASINPQTGKPYGLELSRHHHRRHGGCAGAPDRPSRHRPAVLRHRRLDGRHAGAGVGRAPHGARVRGRADRHRRLAFLAEHRLPRGRPPGRDGRSRLVRRRLPSARQGAAQRPRRRAHGRAHHLSVGGGAAPQVRPQPAGPLDSDVLVQRRLPGRELSAPPGLDLRRPLRRQQLSLHHAGDGLFRSRGRARRRAGQRLHAAPRRASASSRSPATGSIRRARAARSCRR